MNVCPTKFLLANAEAANVQVEPNVRAVGLNDGRSIHSGAIPKRQIRRGFAFFFVFCQKVDVV